MAQVHYGNLPFGEAIAYFRKKGFKLSPRSWRDVWQEAHARAFTVARVTAMDVVAGIRSEVDKALAQGVSLGEFKKSLRPKLQAKGWFAPKGEAAVVTMPDGTKRKRLTGWRLDNIYNTNLQAAYSVGRYKQMEEVGERRPYWQYKSMRLITSRPAHVAQHDKVFHKDHPFWDQWYPPNGFFCKCYVKTLSERQMKARGLIEETRGVAEKPDEGWRFNVGKAGLAAWRPDLKSYPAPARRLLKQTLSREFVPAKTLREAEEWTRRHVGVRVVDYAGGGVWGAPIASKAERLEKLNEIGEEWVRLTIFFPAIERGLIHRLYITRTSQGHAHLGTVRERGRKISMTVADQPSKEQLRRWKEWEEEHGAKSTLDMGPTRIKDNFRHELAHVLSSNEILRRWQQTVPKLVGAGNARIRWFRENISWYAARNVREEIAEAFTLVTSHSYKKGALPAELEEIIYSMLGE